MIRWPKFPKYPPAKVTEQAYNVPERSRVSRDRRQVPPRRSSAPGHNRPGGRRMTIRNPIEWGGSQIVGTAKALSSVGHSLHHVQDTIHSPALTVRHIRVGDIKDAIRQGFEDFEAYRSDVVMLCV